MIPTYFLYQLAEYEGIAIEWRDLQHIKGIYTYTPEMSKPVIILSKALQTKERILRCVLAHELGHHFATAGHHTIAASSTSSVYRTKNERLATKWAVNLLVPTDNFIHCAKHGMNEHDLCNYFYVLPEFIRLKTRLVKRDERCASALAETSATYNIVL